MFKKIARLIYRPLRTVYDPSGMPTTLDVPDFGIVERVPVTFTNPSNETIIGSLYRAPHSTVKACVIYCHGNASNQREGRHLVSWFVPLGVSVFCFDFAGCGCSSGAFISLGYREAGDLAMAIQVLRRQFDIEEFALWGRSMGAVVSLICLAMPELGICAAVVDSPFTSFVDLVSGLSRSHHCPQWLCRKIIKRMRKRILKKAKFDIYDIRPIDSVRACEKPILFVHGDADKVVDLSHTDKLFAASLSADKQRVTVRGKHNDGRPISVLIEATEFLCGALGITVQFIRPDVDTTVQGESHQHHADLGEMLRAA
jgi:pimeloyl-ACP methyl ester carboxylesterase